MGSLPLPADIYFSKHAAEQWERRFGAPVRLWTAYVHSEPAISETTYGSVTYYDGTMRGALLVLTKDTEHSNSDYVLRTVKYSDRESFSKVEEDEWEPPQE